MKSTLTKIDLKELKLDLNNPRFAELYSGSENEDELIEYLLYSESAEDVAQGIDNAGEFYPDRPLWVIQEDGHYLVKDGNRRCAAVKALNHPSKYGMELPKHNFTELPVLLYKKEEDINTRILQEHTNSLFREWDRIAKALEVFKLYSSGSSLENMKEIDSQPSQLIKLASFYYSAVKIAGDDLKKLLRRGRGKSGGKTIIFERLFSYSKQCGYSFRNKPSYKLLIKDNALFETYIKALVRFLQENPKTKTQDVDKDKAKFLDKLKPYGFPPEKPKKEDSSQNTPSDRNTTASDTSVSNSPTNLRDNNGTDAQNIANEDNSSKSRTNSTPNADSNNGQNKGATRYSVKHKPSLKRKQIPSALKKLIDECYSLDENNFANAKTALTRVTLECTLKYVVENTNKPNGKPIKSSNYFNSAFKDRKGIPLTYTNFDTLKAKFTELITDVGIKKAFEDFDIQNPHQIIHNYRVAAVPVNAKALCDNLIDLLEFMLQEEADLYNSLDSTKL
ncbi:MAG: hypothetical protein PHY30_03735 [Candidatus Pacebacteria bacterium]|nr:hypothetical protein [Candidatus Paceibacterota bacterium]